MFANLFHNYKKKENLMKKLLIVMVAVMAICGASNSASAAKFTTNSKSILSVDPVDLINGRVNVTYEMADPLFGGKNNSLTVSGSYWGYSEWLTAFGVGASYRWYLDPFDEGKRSLNGLSVGPRLDFYYWGYDYYGFSDSWSTLAIGAEVNYKWVFAKGKFSVEPTFKFTFPILKPDYGYFGYTNWGFGVNLGYAF
jgi:hypothetical protein